MDDEARHPMPWIETIPDSQWAAIHSLNPAALAAHSALYLSAMTGTATLRKGNWKEAGLSEKRLSMLTYSVKLTVAPGDMRADDVKMLRAVGFSDRDILDIAEVVGYYAYVNRIADGLGVPIEGWISDDS